MATSKDLNRCRAWLNRSTGDQVTICGRPAVEVLPALDGSGAPSFPLCGVHLRQLMRHWGETEEAIDIDWINARIVEWTWTPTLLRRRLATYASA